MQAALAADGNGAPAVRATPIVAGNDDDGEEWLAHPPGIALWRQTGEEELTLQREVPLKEQDGEAGGALEERHQPREQFIVDLTYCEQTVQETFALVWFGNQLQCCI